MVSAGLGGGVDVARLLEDGFYEFWWNWSMVKAKEHLSSGNRWIRRWRGSSTLRQLDVRLSLARQCCMLYGSDIRVRDGTIVLHKRYLIGQCTIGRRMRRKLFLLSKQAALMIGAICYTPCCSKRPLLAAQHPTGRG